MLEHIKSSGDEFFPIDPYEKADTNLFLLGLPSFLLKDPIDGRLGKYGYLLEKQEYGRPAQEPQTLFYVQLPEGFLAFFLSLGRNLDALPRSFLTCWKWRVLFASQVHMGV